MIDTLNEMLTLNAILQIPLKKRDITQTIFAL